MSAGERMAEMMNKYNLCIIKISALSNEASLCSERENMKWKYENRNMKKLFEEIEMKK